MQWRAQPPVDDGEEIDVLATNVPALSVWRLCRKPLLGAGFGVMPAELETTEIEASARALGIAVDTSLLGRIRSLDGAFVAEAARRSHRSGKQRSQ